MKIVNFSFATLVVITIFVRKSGVSADVSKRSIFGDYFGFLSDEGPEEVRTRGQKVEETIPSRRGNTQKSAPDPDTYLEQFGYLSSPRNGESHSPAARRQAVIEFQRMAGLSETGEIDSATRRKMGARRCGMPDHTPVDADVAQNSRSRDEPQSYHVPGYKWSKTSLSWRALSYSRDMASGSQRRAFSNAFKYWSDVTPMRFSERSSGDVDIEIDFGSYDHGDGYPFDGVGGTLAHAFYPEDGSTHFDESEEWTENTDRGTNLEIVAAHEFGHALGLGHSSVQGALMAPFYQGYDSNFRLHSDDIGGIQSLYGPKDRPEYTPAPTSKPRPTSSPGDKPSSGKPDSCTTKFGAIYQGGDGIIYVFEYKWVWKLHYWGMYSDYPVLARKVFTDAPPTNIAAAAYSFRTGYTYFFKGNYVFQYWGTRKVRRSTITTRGYEPPHSAFMASDGIIYVLKGSYYWTFDEGRLTVSTSRRTISSKWPGVPANIEGAVRLNDGYIYFFKGTRYRKYNESTRRVESGYPKDKAGPWMGPSCTSDGQYQRK